MYRTHFVYLAVFPSAVVRFLLKILRLYVVVKTPENGSLGAHVVELGIPNFERR